MGVNAKMLASIECYVKLLHHKVFVTLHHKVFVLLSKHIAIIWKSAVDFPELKILRVLLYLLKYKFHLNKNWIFVPIYGIRILKTKVCFLIFNYPKLKNVINKIINRKLHISITKMCIWPTNLKFSVQNMN